MKILKLYITPLLLITCFTMVFYSDSYADLREDTSQAVEGGANSLEKLKERARQDGALKPEDDTDVTESESDEEFFEDEDNKKKEQLELSLRRPPYTSKGKRDPFKPFIQAPKETKQTPVSESTPPIKRYDLNQYRIVGVVKFSGEPKAMVVDPEKNTYYLGVGDEIGNKNGEILEVRDNGLLVQEKRYFEDVFGESKVEVEKSVLAFVEEEG